MCACVEGNVPWPTFLQALGSILLETLFNLGNSEGNDASQGEGQIMANGSGKEGIRNFSLEKNETSNIR